MLVALVLYRSIRKWMVPYLFAAIISERSVFGDDTNPTESFASLFLTDPGFRDKVNAVAEERDPRSIQAKLVNLALPRLLPDHIGTYAFIWLGLIGHLSLIPVLLLLGWRFV